MPPAIVISVCLASAFVAVAAVLDVRTRRIPNWLTVSVFALGVIFQTAAGGLSGLGLSLGGFAVGFSILFVLWLIGGGGGGDVKLMAALGAWLGPLPILIVFLLSTLLVFVGMVFVLGTAMLTQGYSQMRRRHLVRATAGGANSPSTDEAGAQKQLAKRRAIPYALPVAGATWLVAAWQILIHFR